MSHIEPGDHDLHHVDQSHRWTGGPGHGEAEDAFQQRLRDHKAAHLGLVGREVAVPRARVRWSH